MEILCILSFFHIIELDAVNFIFFAYEIMTSVEQHSSQ